jgi:hypothetical protein
MRVMVIMKASEASEAGTPPSPALLADMRRFTEALVAAGVLLAGEGLHPSAKGVHVRFAIGEPEVFAGPFDVAAGVISGFWIWRVGSLAEAIGWAKRVPNTHGNQHEIEIRPIMSGGE